MDEAQVALHRVVGRQILRDHDVIKLVGLRAEQRLASFLLDFADLLEARGFSQTSLVLRMTREEIAIYLGIQLETVSRCFSNLHEGGLLSVRGHHVHWLDSGALEALVSG